MCEQLSRLTVSEFERAVRLLGDGILPATPQASMKHVDHCTVSPGELRHVVARIVLDPSGAGEGATPKGEQTVQWKTAISVRQNIWLCCCFTYELFCQPMPGRGLLYTGWPSGGVKMPYLNCP